MVTTTAAKINNKNLSLFNSGVVSHFDLAVVVGLRPLLQFKGVIAIMGKSKQLEKNQRFGKLTIMKLDHTKCYISPSGKRSNREYYKCICDCGNIKIIEKSQLTTGHTKSCGCLQKESTRKHKNYHGLSKTKIYSIWSTMKDRCLNPHNKDYINYGNRGIIIQKTWLKFKPFYDWAINNGYQEGLTIERINVNGNYEENNCTWIKNEMQSHNTRANHYITYNGKTQIIEDWAKEMNLGYGAIISGRLKIGWTIEEALTTPIGQKRKSNTYK